MKKILALLLAAVMVVGLVACSTAPKKEEAANNNNAGTGEVTEVTLKVWGPDLDLVEGGWLSAMEAKFAEAHPEYKITWVNEVCNEGDAGTMVSTDPSAAADVYMFANDQLGGLVKANAISRLGGDFEAQVKNDNSQTLVNTVTHTDGNIYGFPVTNNTWFMYYNKDVFTEEDVKSLDTMLTKGTVAFDWGNGWYSGCFFFANGGKCFGDTGADAAAGIQFGADNGGYEAALKMVQLAANPNMLDGGNNMGYAGLLDGTVDAYFSGSWDYADLYAALGDKLGAVQPPMVEIGGQQKQIMSFAGSKAVGVNPNAKNLPAATKFAAFLASVEAQKARYEMRGVIPAASVLANDESVKTNVVAVAEINTMVNAAVAQSAIPEMGRFWTPVGSFGGLVNTGAVDESNYKEQVEQMMEALNATGL